MTGFGFVRSVARVLPAALCSLIPLASAAQSPSPPVHPGWTLSQITSDNPVPTGEPCLSGNGRFIAFRGVNNHAGTSLFLFDSLRSSLTDLTPGNTSDVFLLCSLDGSGRTLTFGSQGDFTGHNPGHYDQVFLADTSSGAMLQVTGAAPFYYNNNYASVNDDGTRVAFSNGPTAYESRVGWYDRSSGVLAPVTADGGGGYSFGPSISGNRIAFSSTGDHTGENPDHNLETFLYDIPSGLMRQITKTTGDSSFWEPKLSADGQLVAFSTSADLTGGNPSHRNTVFLYDATSDRVTQLVAGINAFTLSSDGRWVAVSAAEDLTGENPTKATGLFRVSTGDLSVTQLALYPNEPPMGRMAISGDGSRIAFLSSSDPFGTNPDHGYELFLLERSASVQPTARGWLGSAVLDGAVFTVGGGDCYGQPSAGCAAFGWGEVGTTDAYDTSANVWATKSPLAMSRWSLTSAALGGKLYAIGGTFGIQSYPLSSNEEYDPSTNTWNVRTDMPTPRWKLTSAVVGGRIYAIGGGPSGNQNLATAVVEVYDALSDSWQSETPMPSPRWGMGSAAISDRIFVVGGYLGFTYAYPSGFATGALEILDATSHTWASGPPMPTPRWDAAAVAADGKLYVIGGYDGSRVLSTVEVFDTATGLWDTSSRAPMPTPRTGLAAVVMDGRIYCFGGHDGTNVVSTLEIYDPATDTWTTPGGTSCTLSCSATAPTTATEGQELQFTATATQVGCTGVPTFNWDFGDGTASYQQNPLHSYVARVVPYEWTMIASLPGTPNCTQGGAIEVAPACAPPVITSQPKPDNPVEPGKSVTLTVEAAGAEHFKWYVGETGDIEAPGVNDASSYETPPVTTTTLYRVRVISGCGAFVEGGPYTVRELRVAVLLVHGIRGTAGSFSADDRLYPIGEPGSEAAGPCRPSQAGDYMCFAHNGWLPCSEADFPSPSSRPECLPIMGKLLHDAGFTVAQPFDYRDKTPDETNWSIERLAGELKKHINCVLKGDCIYPRGTRVDAVDIVAHSMGGLITRAYLAGLATDRDAGDAGVSYGGEIRKVVTAGTPHYGGDFARLQTYVPTSLFPFPVPSNSSQGYQMDYGSDFIWKLDQKWRELVTPPIGPDDYMTVVGLAGGQQANDGVVYAASAVLPQGPQEIPHGEFPEGEHVRYVDACHIPGLQLPWPLPDLCPPNTPGLVAAADELHATYQIVRDFLRGEEPAAFLGEPSVAAYGLLLAKLFEESPRAPAELGSGERNLSVAVDGKKADYKLSRDYLFSLSCVFQRNCGNGITIFPISPGEHTITIRASGYRPITQQSEVAWGRPTAIEIEAVPAADLEVVRAALFCRAPTWPVVRVRNVGRLASDTVDLSFFGSDDDKYSGDDVPLATYTLESLSPGKVGGRLYSVPKTTRKYVLAFVNSRGTVPEASRDNNVGVMESCEVAHILRKARATDSQFGRHSANRTVKSGATPGSAFRPLTPAPEQ